MARAGAGKTDLIWFQEERTWKAAISCKGQCYWEWVKISGANMNILFFCSPWNAWTFCEMWMPSWCASLCDRIQMTRWTIELRVWEGKETGNERRLGNRLRWNRWIPFKELLLWFVPLFHCTLTLWTGGEEATYDCDLEENVNEKCLLQPQKIFEAICYWYLVWLYDNCKCKCDQDSRV